MPTISLPENPAALIEGALAGLRYALSERPSAIVNPVTGDEHAVTYSTDGWSIFANVEDTSLSGIEVVLADGTVGNPVGVRVAL